MTLDLRCRFGIHRWGRWEQTSTRRELMPGYWQTGQARHCQRCHFADTRWARMTAAECVRCGRPTPDGWCCR